MGAAHFVAVAEDDSEACETQQHAGEFGAGKRFLPQPQQRQQAGDQRRQAEQHRNQPRVDVLRAPVGERHRAEHANARSGVAGAGAAVQRQADAPGGEDERGDRETDRHARGDGK